MSIDPKFFDDLLARGLVQDSTDQDALRQRLTEKPISVYCGFDPTATSLHVGNLLGLLLLRRFQQAGHTVFMLAGGATGMIGDPSGKSDERTLLDDEALEKNLAAIKSQLQQFLDLEGDNPAEFVDNKTWIQELSMLEFLRDVGKHATVNHMLAKDSIKSRTEGENGISYTEFSYMLLQAYDFYWLHQNKNCEMQIGGSDQWGNITAGTDLIRRKAGEKAYAFTNPLLLKPDGTKYGKTAGGETLWLDPSMLSPYRFYQSWMQTEDVELEKLFLWLTFISTEEVAALLATHAEAPQHREGQKRFAFEITQLVHGAEAAASAVEASNALFSGNTESIQEATFEMLAGEIPTVTLDAALLENGYDLVELLVAAEVTASKSEASRLLKQRGISINGTKVDQEYIFSADSLEHGRYCLVRRGKKSVFLLDFSDSEVLVS